MAMAGYPIFSAGTGDSGGKYAGMFFFRNPDKGIAVTGVSDGTSNTIMVGEYSDCNVDFGAGNVLTGDCAGGWASGPLYTYWGIRGGQNGAPARPAFGWYSFGSRHAGITNFAFGDGSVRGLTNNINYTAYVQLGGSADGDIVNLP
jgi:prepilin-type processing-associated H-X9-DG protein